MVKIIEGAVSIAIRAVEAAVIMIVADKIVKAYNERTQKERA